MKDNELEQLHSALLRISDEINRICQENDIKYSLYGGSLIGAVRHKGFIPWDDDLDIAMLREDYDRFVKICSKKLNPAFGIISCDTSEDYGYGFCKITLKGTCMEQIGVKSSRNLEVYVDVFPYDNIPESTYLRKKQKYKNYLLMKVLEEKYDGVGPNAGTAKKMCYMMFHVFNFIANKNKLKKKLLQNMTKYNNDLVTKDVSCICGYYGYDRETMPRVLFDEHIDYLFEGRVYRGINNYDYYLNRIYGDYMQLPPEDKRHTHNLRIVNLKIRK